MGNALRVPGTEYHVVTNSGDICLVFDQLEIPSHRGGITIKNGPNQTVVFDDESSVDSLVRVS